MIASIVCATAAAAQTGGGGGQRLQAIVDAFARQSPPDQYRQLGDALAASPALTSQLNGLAAAGRLTGIDISPHLQNAMFHATIEKGHIVFAPDFLPQVATRLLYDVVHPGDLWPNNLVFVLGSLALHLATPPVSMNTDANSFVQASMRKDASAFIQGWNDVMDAARKANGNRQVTGQQFSSLVLNLRYRAVFIKGGVNERIKWSEAGTISPTEENVSVIAKGLETLGLMDFGVAPGS